MCAVTMRAKSRRSSSSGSGSENLGSLWRKRGLAVHALGMILAYKRRDANCRVATSHRREVIHHREIEIFRFQLERKIVVNAEAAHLEQEIAGVAAAEG